MSIYAMIYLAMCFIDLGISIAEHGKEKKGKENAYTSIIAVLIAIFLLYKGGFFN